MMESGLLIAAAFTLAFSLIAKRLSASIVTAPLAFLALGFVLAESGLVHVGEGREALHFLAEITLVLVLFSDAAQVDLGALRRQHVWPLRMLLIGMPLAIGLGTVAFLVLLPEWPLASVALLAAILAPTDAALGQAVVTNSQVPARVRQVLTVESGLNDGMALPAVLFFACAAAAGVHDVAPDNWLVYAGQQIGFGALAGGAVGAVGGWLMLAATARGLTEDAFEGIGVLGLAGLAYLVAEAVGGNGFIAAFVGGLGFGNVLKQRCKFVREFAETEGQLLVWATFLLLGAALLPAAVHALDWRVMAVTLVALLIVRPLAIWLSMIGTEATPLTRIFLGWFGPRGLASALFALLVIDEVGPAMGEAILSTAVVVVAASALLHGVTAAPGARWYGARVAAEGDSPEMTACDEPAKPLKTR